MNQSELPILPYRRTSGFSGSETSYARAVEADQSGRTKQRQEHTLRFLNYKGYAGATWKEIADHLGLHHGSASGTLSVLHKAGKVVRLKQTRDKCKIYVLPEYQDNQPTESFGGKRVSRSQIIKEIEAFAGDYSHLVAGREVVIVDQLLAFLKVRS